MKTKLILMMALMLVACGRQGSTGTGQPYTPGPAYWLDDEPLPAVTQLTLKFGDGCEVTKSIPTYTGSVLTMGIVFDRIATEGDSGSLQATSVRGSYILDYAGEDFTETDSTTCVWNLPEAI